MLLKYRKENYDAFIGERIDSLMKSHKIKHTLLAESIGIGRMTIKRIVSENRRVREDEMEAIAEYFRVDVDRVTMDDTLMIVKEVTNLIHTLSNKERLMELTQSLCGMKMIGHCEMSYYYSLRGQAYMVYGEHKTAEDYYHIAVEQAILSSKQEFIIYVINNTLSNLIRMKHFSEAKKLIEQYKHLYQGNLVELGRLTFSYANCILSTQGKESAYKAWNEALDYYETAVLTNIELTQVDRSSMARLRFNIASMDMDNGNIEKGIHVLRIASDNVEDESSLKIHVLKELSRALIKLGKNDEALQYVNMGVQEIAKLDVDMSEMYGKLLLQKAFITNNVEYAIEATQLEKLSNKTRLHANHTVATIYQTSGDFQSACTYFTKVMELSTDRISPITQL